MKRQWMALGLVATCAVASAEPFVFSTGNVTNAIAVGARPAAPGKVEIEPADDFVLALQTALTSANFTGLLPPGASASAVTQVVVEIYRVFPLDSVDPPSGHVPTRVNSPSDVAFTAADSAGNTLNFSATVLNPSFTALNSVLNGINPIPNQTTFGEGAVNGVEVRIGVTFPTPLVLPAGHYFFVAQALLASGDFYWLSGTRPIVAPGTPFTGDLQAWIRNANLDPDWLRIGTDIIGGVPAPTYNLAFELSGNDDRIFADGFD